MRGLRLISLLVLTIVSSLTAGCILYDASDLDDVDPPFLDDFSDDPSAPAHSADFSNALVDMQEENLRDFLQGRALFELEWSPSEVGPVFNSISCNACHVRDGRAAPDTEGLLFRLSLEDGSPEPTYGGQLQPRGIGGAPGEGDVVIRTTEILGEFVDGSPYSLAAPEYRFVDLAYGRMSADVLASPRIAQQMIGLGLLEAIADDSLLAGEDEEDADGDGISGRANWVTDLESGALMVGRFGWKANQPTLRQQNAGAFHGDLGMTTALFPESPCTSAQEACLEADFPRTELREDQLSKVTRYTQLLAPPEPRVTDGTRRGRQLFFEAGCESCHRETWTTGPHELQELSHRTIRPYTDLLLHDMGPGLSDDRPDGLATGREWRTPPLWGVGHVERVNGHTRFLHDGRARNLEEAILWHGGEARVSQENYRALSASERAELVQFLESL